jgi:uncharacterized membrane protein YuzA (DUF378 family)
MSHTIQTKLHILLFALVIVGALNWGLVAFGYNLVTTIDQGLNGLLGTQWPIQNVVYVVVAVSAVLLLFRRDSWLPFLGHTVVPSSLLKETTPSDATKQVTISCQPHTKVLYWASEKKEEAIPDVFHAYGDFENAGVTFSDASGQAVLRVRAPTPYKVMKGLKTLPMHVHYRTQVSAGILGPVQTVFLH